jgi:glycosyltransferase involved in cell wall biosynthesis
MTPASPNANVLRYIAQNRISPRTINESQRIRSISEWMGGGENHIPRYIMSLATIEPRKNYGRLIEAWQVVRAQGHDDVRLMIVGSPGWLYAGTLKAMRPYIERGELLHLEKVAQSELPMLYSCASVFCFPSMAEGFGLPPTEAMQCSCPVVLSDIPAHRYMAGESALMCDPYSVADIADKLTVALTDDEVRKSLKHKGLENVKRFTVDEVLPKWEDFFEKNRLPQASR